MGATDDSASIDRLLRHSDWLRSLARRLTDDEAAADDLAQETWVAALRHPPQPGRSVRAWLTTVGRRLARRHAWRRELSRDVDDLAQGAADTPAALDVVARIEQERRLAGLVLALEEPYREVVLQRFYRGRSAEQIARDQDVPAATVRTRLRRALDLLHERLDRTQEADGRTWLSALAPLLHDTGTLGAAGNGALVMSTKTVVISVISGAICALAVTEGALPLLLQDPAPVPSAAREVAALPAAAKPELSESAEAARAEAPPAPDGGQDRASERVVVRADESKQSPGELHKLLLSSSRLDQVRAIAALLQQGTPEASRVLLDAYFEARDPLLVGLIEEALLASPVDVAPALMDAYYAAGADPETLRRLSEMLPKLAQQRPELAEEIVGMFIGALDQDPSESTSAALVAFGAQALDGLGRYIADPASSTEGAGTAAWVMAQLPPEEGDALHAKLSEGLATALAAPGDPHLPAEEQEAAIKKVGSLVWAAGLRPPEEHDRLGQALVENLLNVGDPAQAGTLGWGLASLKGLTGSARVQMSTSLLDALDSQANAELKQHYVRLVGQLAQDRPVDESFYEVLAIVERAQELHRPDAALSAQLERLASELRAKELEQGG